MRCACYADGSFRICDDASCGDGALATFAYEPGLLVNVHVRDSEERRFYSTVRVPAMKAGECRKLVDLEEVGEDAKIVSYGLPTALARKKKTVQSKSIAAAKSKGETGASLWRSGIEGVPTALPNGTPAFLILNSEPYDAIEAGVKRVEYRKNSPKYLAMFETKHPAAVRFQRGYVSMAPQMIWEIARVDVSEDEIAISLGKRLS